MGESTTFIGLDVHQASVTAAVWRPGAGAPEVGAAPVEVPKLVRWVQRLAAGGPVHVAYEAGPCGYPLVRALTRVGVHCTVVVPSLIPQAAGGAASASRPIGAMRDSSSRICDRACCRP